MRFYPGSIIKVRMTGLRGLCGLLWHMGIYIGKNNEGMEQVIHYGAPRSRDGAGWQEKTKDIIAKVLLSAFEKDNKARLHAAPLNEAHARRICKLAERLHQNDRNPFNTKRYHWYVRNCEYFCKRCYEAVCERPTTQPA